LRAEEEMLIPKTIHTFWCRLASSKGAGMNFDTFFRIQRISKSDRLRSFIRYRFNMSVTNTLDDNWLMRTYWVNVRSSRKTGIYPMWFTGITMIESPEHYFYSLKRSSWVAFSWRSSLVGIRQLSHAMTPKGWNHPTILGVNPFDCLDWKHSRFHSVRSHPGLDRKAIESLCVNLNISELEEICSDLFFRFQSEQ
jgi:hypothetical protein